MLRTVGMLAAIGLAAALSGCSQSPETGARALVDQWVTQESLGYLQVEQFTVKEVVAGKRSGTDTFTVRYALEATALRDGGYVDICQSRGEDAPLSSPRVREAPDQSECYVFQSKKGRRYRFAVGMLSPEKIEEITIARHERGWAEVR